MYWKRLIKAPRPAQLYPALMPMVPTPRHASYPSNHSLQSHLVAYVMGAILKDPATGAEHGIVKPALALAARIARNREIAGVHFKDDSKAGADYAKALAEFWNMQLSTPAPAHPATPEEHMQAELAAIVSDVKKEWAHTKAFQTPDAFMPFRSLPDVIADKIKP
jgi:membrane-associated phospholipid phosphatase